MSVRLLQPLNAYEPILVILSGRLIDVRLVQPLNVCVPMLVSPSGRLMDVRLVQDSKAQEIYVEPVIFAFPISRWVSDGIFFLITSKS